MVQVRVSGAMPPGDLLAVFRQRAEQSVTAAMRGTAAGLLTELRQQIAAAFPESRRLPTALTGRGYPDRAGVASLSAAAVVRARASAAEILVAHEGSLIRPNGRQALAIPTKEVPRIAGRRLTPREVEARFGSKLELLPPGTLGATQKNAVLVLRVSHSSGRRRGRVVARRENRVRVMFILTRGVALASRLAPEPVVEKWAGRVPGLIDQAWNQLARER